MKIYAPDTKKEYICENEFDYQIQRYCELKKSANFSDEVIEWASRTGYERLIFFKQLTGSLPATFR